MNTLSRSVDSTQLVGAIPTAFYFVFRISFVRPEVYTPVHHLFICQDPIKMSHSEYDDDAEDPVQYPYNGDYFSQGSVSVSESEDPICDQPSTLQGPGPNIDHQEVTIGETSMEYLYGNSEDHTYDQSEVSYQDHLSNVQQQYEYEAQGSATIDDSLNLILLTPEPVPLSSQRHIQSNLNVSPNTLHNSPRFVEYLNADLRHDPWNNFTPRSSQWPVTYGQSLSQPISNGQGNQAICVCSYPMPHSSPQDPIPPNFMVNSQQTNLFSSPNNIACTDTVPRRDPQNAGWDAIVYQKPPEPLVCINPNSSAPGIQQEATAFAAYIHSGLETHYRTAPAGTYSLVGHSPEYYRPSRDHQVQSTGYVDSRFENMQITDNEFPSVSYGQTGAQVSSSSGLIGQHAMSSSKVSPSKRKVKARRTKARPQPAIRPHLSSDNTPSEDASINTSPYQVLDADMQPTFSRRTRKLSADGRRHAKEMRKYGACEKCRRKKSKV